VKQLLELMLRTAALRAPPVADPPQNPSQDARIKVRLRPDDRLLLASRAKERGLTPATYVSVLVRAHLRNVTPLPKDELLALKQSIAELRAIGRNLNQMSHALNHGRESAPGVHEVMSMLKVTVFAKVYVITGENHVDAILASVPKEVGVLRLDNRQYVSTVREAADHPERTSPAAILDSIRTQEARMILESRGVTTPCVPSTALHCALRELFLRLSPVEAHRGMVEVSLHTAALSVPMRKLDHTRFLSAVN
jgi:hypothetical protein